MTYYKSFNAEALELSRSLPEEQSELYKRHFVPLPLEKFEEAMKNVSLDEDEPEILKGIAQELFDKLKIKFDLIVGATSHIDNRHSKDLRVVNISEIPEERFDRKMYKSADDKLVAFIHAHTKKIIFVEIPDSKTAELSVLFVNSSRPFTTQVFVDVGRSASLNLFEWYASCTKEKSLLGALHEVSLGPYAKSEINVVHNEDKNTYIVGFTKGKVEEKGTLRMNYAYNGGASTRVKNEISASGYGADNRVVELVMGSGEQKFDISTVIANLAQDTVSDLESKAALADSTFCVLKGFANVGESAKGSRSFVNERGILLSKKAYLSSIPGMSINNADVRATHSSATAPVDADSLFYLMSRGADSAVATRLIVAGFFANSVSKIRSPIMKLAVSSLMHEKINNKKFGETPMMDLSSVWAEQTAAQDMFEGHYKYRTQK